MPPARRLVVPRGHTAHWGVDPGCQRVAIACSDPAFTVSTASFPPLDGGTRLAWIYAETRRFCVERLGEGWRAPGLVFVEQPSGKQPNPQLSYAVGVIIAAVSDGVHAVTGHRVRVETVASSAWKLRATGFGGHRKTVRPYGVLQWAAVNGYAGKSYDEADALGIMEAARRTVALEAR
jgi:hypothetical protein